MLRAVQLPIFPDGLTHITAEIVFQRAAGKVYYFNKHLPVFVHEERDLATFRIFTSQLAVNWAPLDKSQLLANRVDRRNRQFRNSARIEVESTGPRTPKRESHIASNTVESAPKSRWADVPKPTDERWSRCWLALCWLSVITR